jgi:hypothetical protein
VIAPRATDTVVADLHAKLPVPQVSGDLGATSPSVLDHVRKRFADHEIGGRLDAGRKAPDAQS